MELFYTPSSNITQKDFLITNSEARHIIRVLRKKIDDELFFTDGCGWQYRGRITEMRNLVIKGEVLESTFIPREPGVRLTLAFGLLKGARNDFLIEKCTELGVYAFQPFLSRYSVIHKPGPNKILRFSKIAQAAMKQSLRTILPAILPVIPFSTLIDNLKDFNHVLVADPNGPVSLDTRDLSGQSSLLIIGPEGGLAREEIDALLIKGAKSFSLGKTRLRSETAALAATARILLSQ
ncbi:MAG: RsmE family RNA methyltransferase [candidate division WOR-3 bacterium]